MQLLDLSYNEVADLEPLKKMSNLRNLYARANRLEKFDAVGELGKIWSLDISENKITDLGPVGKLEWLTSLNFNSNAVSSLEPLSPLTDLDRIQMKTNQIKDLGPLVEMCQKDAEGERRFAPYLRVHLDGNPLDEQTKDAQVELLKSFGCENRITVDQAIVGSPQDAGIT